MSLNEWRTGPVPEPHAGVVLLVVETNGDPWAYTAGTHAGRPDWVMPDGDPLGWSEFGADGCCSEGERWMLTLSPSQCPRCGEDPERNLCNTDAAACRDEERGR